jgi:integrase
MQLWKHKNGTWYVLYGPRLKSQVSTRCKDRASAEIFLSQFIAVERTLAPEAPLLSAILDRYAADRLPEIRGPKQQAVSIAPLRRHLGNLLPKHLTPPEMKDYAKNRKAEGVGNGTILREMGALRAALKHCSNLNWYEKFPEIPNPVSTPRPRRAWATKEEAQRIIDACHEPHVRLFCIMAFGTAARPGAILELKWDQVDFKMKFIDYGEGHGNKRRAIVPLNDTVLKAVSAAKELACSDYVIEYRGEPVATVKNAFKAACRRAGVVGVTPHICRHSAATWMAIDGVPLEAVADILGDSKEIVEKVYRHMTPEYGREGVKATELK